MTVVKATAKGQVVIPAEVRKKYNIVKGTKVKVEDRDGEIVVKPLLADAVREARGLYKSGKSALKALAEDRQKEAQD